MLGAEAVRLGPLVRRADEGELARQSEIKARKVVGDPW